MLLLYTLFKYTTPKGHYAVQLYRKTGCLLHLDMYSSDCKLSHWMDYGLGSGTGLAR